LILQLYRLKQGEYKIYNALVDSWLSREEVKNKNRFPKSELFKACENPGCGNFD